MEESADISYIRGEGNQSPERRPDMEGGSRYAQPLARSMDTQRRNKKTDYSKGTNSVRTIHRVTKRLRQGDIFWEKGLQYILSTPF